MRRIQGRILKKSIAAGLRFVGAGELPQP